MTLEEYKNTLRAFVTVAKRDRHLEQCESDGVVNGEIAGLELALLHAEKIDRPDEFVVSAWARAEGKEARVKFTSFIKAWNHFKEVIATDIYFRVGFAFVKGVDRDGDLDLIILHFVERKPAVAPGKPN